MNRVDTDPDELGNIPVHMLLAQQNRTVELMRRFICRQVAQKAAVENFLAQMG
ncbi:MAG: hypothetical protein AB8B79_05980 [Granulosicoccus sp.]